MRDDLHAACEAGEAILAMASIALVNLLLGLALGYLIWS